MKEKFKEVKIEVIPFDDADVITSSGLETSGSYDDSSLGDYFNELFNTGM